MSNNVHPLRLNKVNDITSAEYWTDFKHKYRHWPIALLLCLIYIGCLLLFASTFVGNGFGGPLAPFYAIWVALGLGIFMCVLSFVMVDCHVPKTWVEIKNWNDFRNNLMSIELPNQYAYYGPSPTTRKYTHHFIITNYELIYPPNSDTTDPSKAVDAKVVTKEYIDIYFPRLWYQQPRAVCCCSGKRCCCFGWVGAGMIQRREYLASDILKKHRTVMNVRKNGDMPLEPIPDRLRRLQQRNGEPFWDLLINNCEHYANWIMTGEHYAVQIATGPFWELYFLNSIGRVLLGAMRSVLMTIIFRLAFVVLFVMAYKMSFQHTLLVYWIIVYFIVAYNFLTYLVSEVAKVIHLNLWCGKNRWCYPCYSDYVDNKPVDDRLIVDDNVQTLEVPSVSEINGVLCIEVPPANPQVKTVWPHEGLKRNSEFSMPILTTLFKAFYLFMFSTAALFGGSWIGQGLPVHNLLPKIEGLPLSELIMQCASSLSIYVFWYPLMTSSLDFFLWHKPNKILSAFVYLAFAICLIYFMYLIIVAGIAMNLRHLQMVSNATHRTLNGYNKNITTLW